jgi:hypothetical protein
LNAGAVLTCSAYPTTGAAGDTVLLVGRLDYQSQPVPCEIQAQVADPDSTRTIVLNDQGLNGDVTAGDLTYSIYYVLPPLEAALEVVIRAEAPLSGQGSVVRTSLLDLVVECRPDVAVLAADVSWSPSIPATLEECGLQAVIRNLASVPADSVAVSIWDRSADALVASIVWTLAGSDSLLLSVPWTPQLAGEHNLEITVNLLGRADADLANNMAVVGIPVSGTGVVVSVPDLPTVTPLRNHLSPPAPNPSNDGAALHFEIAQQGPVTLRVFDIQGRLVREVLNEDLEPGVYARTWDGTNDRGQRVATGIYFVLLRAKDAHHARRLLILR